MWVLGLLPFAALAALVALFARGEHSWRLGLVRAAPLWGALVVLSTEVLTLVHGLVAAPLVLLWTATLALAVLGPFLPRAATGRPRLPRPEWRGWARRGSAWTIGSAAALTLLTALMAPPNTWDSMTYHMARVAHWAQNGGIQPYPTSISRQIWVSPGAELLLAHLQVMVAGDRLANLPQWLAMVGSVAIATLLAGLFGAGPRGQAAAGAFVATLPMGIVQASGTQNDYVAAFWLMTFVASVALIAAQGRCRCSSMFWLSTGAALGMALVTKGTMYLFAAPFCLWLAVLLPWRRPLRAVGLGSMVTAVVVLLNLGYFARNMTTFGSPFGPDEGVVNRQFGLAPLVSNAVRGLAVHIGTPLPAVNHAEEGAIVTLLGALGMDANDPDTTFPGNAFHVPLLSTHEDVAGNPIHLVLAAVALTAAILGRGREDDAIRRFSIALVGGYALFAGYLRWQPWESRLELPLFVLAGAVVGTVAGRVLAARHLELAGVALAVAALPWLLLNNTRPLLLRGNVFQTERSQQYFTARPALQASYVEAAAEIRRSGCGHVGVVLGGDDWEYPLWALLGAPASGVPLIEHVFVRAPQMRAMPPREAAGEPCALFTTVPDPAATELVGRYTVAWRDGDVKVWLPRQPGGDTQP